MQRNMTLKMDPYTYDIAIDAEGVMQTLYDDDTTAQCIRLTLLAYMGDFPLDEAHGTEYDRILGQRAGTLNMEEVKEVLRGAIFQETDVAQIDSMSCETDGRALSVAFSATLNSGKTVSMEVNRSG